MSDTNNMKDILSNYVSKEEFLTETLYGEGSILIDAYSLESLNNTMPYSVFDMTITEKGYIAGISGITSSYFISDNSHDHLKYISSANNTITDAEKDSEIAKRVVLNSFCCSFLKRLEKGLTS